MPMENVNRRDAVKLVTAGAVATGLTALSGSTAEAQDKKTLGSSASTGKIEGIRLPAGLGTSLGGSPEDAAKVFLKAATQGLANVIADSLAQAVGSVGSSGVGAAPDWIKLIKGCIVDIAWETPGKTALQTATAIATSGSSIGGQSLGGWEVSVGIKGSF
jgi:hypothetical protein